MKRNQQGFNFCCSVVAALLCIGSAGLMAGCEEDSENYLEGSATDSYDMGFDFVRIRMFAGSALSIEYVKEVNNGEKIALKVTIDKTEAELAAGGAWNLLSDGSIAWGIEDMSVSMPNLVSGSVTLDSYGAEQGSKVSGSFESVFSSATGRRMNLRGGFAAEMELLQ